MANTSLHEVSEQCPENDFLDHEPLATVPAPVEVDGLMAPSARRHAHVIKWKTMLIILQTWSSPRASACTIRLSAVFFVPSFSGTNFTEIEVHPRVQHRRHSDTEVSIDKIFSLASDKAVDIGENDEASNEDAMSVNFVASWECGKYF
ncbi:Uncharacterized protein TCM_009211 [Theobroma cacao]|uniref:Uncharacterized protein n=1 Tax=Theobroma cacao TaxID=3641 RepID=A0A061E4U1_THECC|nr:Uncharacterized protein TCM_009211 [Theobroma cacao]